MSANGQVVGTVSIVTVWIDGALRLHPRRLVHIAGGMMMTCQLAPPELNLNGRQTHHRRKDRCGFIRQSLTSHVQIEGADTM
ncbi:hypothetical protein PSTT_06052 [Puccinia striiformis]|uniref:Uncharacterized protein n=1 Tax=Puccinia striiformis TaxID=27350 RepID=A0A2S4VLL5_9BASI|nr:hypothetical protein PSTT_06052 [Puccinia striiformis]